MNNTEQLNKLSERLKNFANEFTADLAKLSQPDKVVVNGVEMDYETHNNCVCWENMNIGGGEYFTDDEIKSLYTLTQSPELKTILDGFNKQK